jgi:hypothetical protein
LEREDDKLAVEEKENKGGSGRGKTISWLWKRKKIKEAVGEGRRLTGSGRGRK